MQHVIGMAMTKLFNQNEEQYYLEKAKKAGFKRKIVNFFHEVSKNVTKYELRNQSPLNEP